MMKALRLPAGCKGLRGTPLDLFSYTADRHLERELIADYEAVLDEVLAALTPHNLDAAVALAALPADIRGFGLTSRTGMPPTSGGVRRSCCGASARSASPAPWTGDALPKSDVIMAG